MKFFKSLFVMLGLAALFSRFNSRSATVALIQAALPTSTPGVVTEVPILSHGRKLTEAQKLMDSLSTLKVNHARLKPVQSAQARQEALSLAAERRKRKALRYASPAV